MNVIPAFMTALRRNQHSNRNFRLLFQVLILLLVLIVSFSFIFYYLMKAEGQDFCLLTSFYWVLVTMTTLGYGDITFSSLSGQVFSLIVLITGIVLIFIVLPFTFIESIYASWVEANRELKAPRKLSRFFSGHVIITSVGPVAFALIRRLESYNYSYVLLVPDYDQALPLSERGMNVMVGDLDNPDTYRQAQIGIASMVAATGDDPTVNVNVIMTVKRLAPKVPVVALCHSRTSRRILDIAGSEHTLDLSIQLGDSLARLAYPGEERAQVAATFGTLAIAEARVRGTDLVDQTVGQTSLQKELGISIVGSWRKGEFIVFQPGMRISRRSILVLAGKPEQVEAFNRRYPDTETIAKPVVIIGGGRVGQAAARRLDSKGIDYRIIEREPTTGSPSEKTVIGDASRDEVLVNAGINDASTVLITTHNDNVNIYLTLLLRHLNPEMMIISRSMRERNLANLYRAGADYVMSHASMGAKEIFNLLKRGNIEMLAEGLDVFSLPVPPKLVGKRLADAQIRKRTGCIVVAVKALHGVEINPDPREPLPDTGSLVLIATVENEARFLRQFPPRKF